MNLLQALQNGQVCQQHFEPGLYEIIYSFVATDFDPSIMTFDWHGRSTGPWDYAPSGPDKGDCLLPCVHFTSSTGINTKARVFIPRREELDQNHFNGRLGFHVEQAGEISLQVSTEIQVQWLSVDIQRVTDFKDVSLTASDIDTKCLFFMDQTRLEQLRINWGKAPWSQCLDEALDDCGRMGPPLCQEDANVVVSAFLKTRQVYEDNAVFWGDYLLSLSLRTLLFERDADIAQLASWIDALIALPVWGHSKDPHGLDHNNDLTADFHMIGLVVAVNWHASRLGKSRVERAKEKIRYQAQQMLNWITTARSSWPGVNTQNHAYFGYQTLLMAGAALLDADKNDSQALDFLQIAAAAFKRFTDNLPSDGTYHEGIGYISFGMLGLLPALMLLEQITDRQWLPHDWLDAHFPAMNALTPMQCNSGFSIDDGDGCYPCNAAFTLWAARKSSNARTRDAAGQLLAKLTQVDNKALLENKYLIGNFWLTVLSPDVLDLGDELPEPTSQTEPYTLLPAAGYCVCHLSDHRKAYFLTAPPHGHELFNREHHTYAYGHHHPDTGNILLINNGQWVLADTGYTYCKASSEHNVLLVDGQGQYNDNYVWMPPPPWNIKPSKVHVDHQNGIIRATIDMAYIYPQHLGLNSWQRTLITADGCIIVIDQVITDKPASLSISWGSDATWTNKSENTWKNGLGWTLSIHGNPTTVTRQTIRPARRNMDRSIDWHVLRLGSTQPVTRYHVASVFLAPEYDGDADSLLMRLGLENQPMCQSTSA
jgi:hypothetical protein